MRGSHRLAEGRYTDTVRLLHPIRKILHRFGGSNAQRDAVARTLLEAAIRSGESALAVALVSERIALKESIPYNRRQRDRIAPSTPSAGAPVAAAVRPSPHTKETRLMAGKAVISLTTGLEDTEKVTVAFLVAVGAADAGRPTLMFLTKEAVRLALDGVAVGVAATAARHFPIS